jgi:hypothetical protein
LELGLVPSISMYILIRYDTLCVCWCYVLRWIWCLWCYSECASTPGKLKSLPDDGGNWTMWMHTQSNTANTIFTWVHNTNTHKTFKKVANCVNYKIKLKQSNFERNSWTLFMANTRH